MGAIRLRKGLYEYKGHKIINHGYYAPDQCVWWEAVDNNTGCANYHAHTKKEIMDMIDEDIKEEVKVVPIKCEHNDCFNCPYPDCINDYVKPYNADYYKEYREKHQKELNKKKRQLRAERKANGICTSCGKRPVQEGKTKCMECLLKLREYSIARNRKKSLLPRELLNEKGLCVRCSKNKVVDGYKLCETCLEKARQSIEYGRSVRTKESYEKFTR